MFVYYMGHLLNARQHCKTTHGQRSSLLFAHVITDLYPVKSLLFGWARQPVHLSCPSIRYLSYKSRVAIGVFVCRQEQHVRAVFVTATVAGLGFGQP